MLFHEGIVEVSFAIQSWGAEGRQQPLPLKLCLQYLTLTDIMHRVGQDWCLEQFGIQYSPINAPQGQEMNPCG